MEVTTLTIWRSKRKFWPVRLTSGVHFGYTGILVRQEFIFSLDKHFF
jgi:hypothetical protein